MPRTFNADFSCTVAFMAYAATAAILFFAIPVVAHIYEDFDMELPSLTLIIIQSKIALTITLALASAAVIIKEFALRRREETATLINLVSIAVLFLAIGVIVIGVILPLANITPSVM